ITKEANEVTGIQRFLPYPLDDMTIEKSCERFPLPIKYKTVFPVQTLQIARAKARDKQIIKIEGAYLPAILGNLHTPHDTKIVDVASLSSLRVTKTIGHDREVKYPVHVSSELLIVHSIRRVES